MLGRANCERYSHRTIKERRLVSVCPPTARPPPIIPHGSLGALRSQGSSRIAYARQIEIVMRPATIISILRESHLPFSKASTGTGPFKQILLDGRHALRADSPPITITSRILSSAPPPGGPPPAPAPSTRNAPGRSMRSLPLSIGSSHRSEMSTPASCSRK
jgi:hypothetical protein